MLKINTNIQGLSQLKNHIDFVNKMLSMKTDFRFQKFIQDKVLDIARKVTDERLIGGTTNDDSIELYKSNHKIREESDGFVLYNDTVINANTSDLSSYPNGTFNIALAFEYGVGIVGASSPIANAWQYDVNNHGQSGWVFIKDNGEWERTTGYTGFEIYRYIAIEVKSKLKEWVEEYYRKEVK